MIFVLPTEEGKPTRAVLGEAVLMDEQGRMGLAGPMLEWSMDFGTWLNSKGTPVDSDLAAELTERCKVLEVPGFG